MKRPQLSILIILAFITSFTLVAPGCLGVKARDHVGTAALDTAGDGLKLDAVAGVATLPDVEESLAMSHVTEFFEIIDSKDRVRIAGEAMPLWTEVKSLANAGIDSQVTAGSLGTNGAISLKKRVTEFEKLLNKTVERLE